MHLPRTTLQLSKFDVAERQLNQAILLFFDDADSVSVHTLAEAASQILYDIRDQTGAVSLTRDSKCIKPKRRKEWLALVAQSRNFFKHADRDKAEQHEFKDEFNHFSLCDAVNMYLTAKKAWTPESLVYFAWFCASYPHLVIKGTDTEVMTKKFTSGPEPLDVRDRSLFAESIRAVRTGKFSLPSVCLSMGLRSDA